MGTKQKQKHFQHGFHLPMGNFILNSQQFHIFLQCIWVTWACSLRLKQIWDSKCCYSSNQST